MRVHIVCRKHGENDILGRKAHALASVAQWSLDSRPNPDADINYFFPYIEYSELYPDFDDTLLAAYFTHKETEISTKVQWWNYATERMDLCLTSSRVSLACLPPQAKDTALVPRPPIDREKFSVNRRETSSSPVIGVAGFVDRLSKRKGEHLLARLAYDLREVEFKGIGRGWPVPTRFVQPREIPQFYNSIDLFLCTSTLEGVPMPPLEALACGTPVLVPTNVGIMDDLPDDVIGITKYESGNYDDLLKKARAALQELPQVDHLKLRETSSPYTPENWARDHMLAMENLMYPPRSNSITLPPKKDNSGMYCVAFGEPSRRCARKCIQAFKKHMPDTPVALASTKPLGPEDIFVKRDDIDVGGRLAKLAAYTATPQEWQYVLYLDADTEVVGDVSFLYKLLADGWEAAICKDMYKYYHAGMMKRPDNHAETNVTLDLLGTDKVFQYNGGMFAFRRCENVRCFFELWNREWQRWAARDQGALLRALYKNPLRMFVLFNQWNATDRYPKPVGDIAIWHHNMYARRWGRSIKGRTDSDDAWRAVSEWRSRHGDKSPAGKL